MHNAILDAKRRPTSIAANGHEYRLNTDFRVVLGYLRLMTYDDMNESEKVLTGISLFIGTGFYQADVKEIQAEIRAYILRNEKPGDDKKEPLFDYLVDSGRIMAAFLQVYGIDLEVEKMHWWRFVELLDGLPNRTHLSEVIEIRGRKIDKHMSPAEKNELTKLKHHYRIVDDGLVET
jgi:hypothetical protein